MRAVGRGMHVAVVQFMKPNISGERAAAERLYPELQVFGESRPYDVCANQKDSVECREDARSNFTTARNLMASGLYDMLILDEIDLVLFYGFVSRDEMLEFLKEKPDGMELILTGRYAPGWLIEAADLVTEMVEVKHPGSNGVPARKGIEY